MTSNRLKDNRDNYANDEAEDWLRANDPNYYKNNKMKIEEYPYLSVRGQRRVYEREIPVDQVKTKKH